MLETDEGSSNPVSVHRCSKCNRAILPEQFTARDTVRGIYECPYCHSSEPLNLQIVPRSEVARD
jgi:DNA-directed RNA polymerase subunit RPC12/RpoP